MYHDSVNHETLMTAPPAPVPTAHDVSPIAVPDVTPRVIPGDARDLAAHLPRSSVDVIVTSPPYWRKRDYGHERQLGQEPTPEAYVEALLDIMQAWRPVLRPSASVFINIADSYRNRRLMGVPSLLELGAARRGWRLAHRIIWAKDSGVPEAHSRLAQRHEYILHFAWRRDYHVDLFAYSKAYGAGSNPGNVWNVPFTPHKGEHLAPYPEELARRMILLACPERVCAACGRPLARQVTRGERLNLDRPQARRALELYRERNLTPAHLAAIRATGISDAGKAMRIQDGAGRNSAEVRRLAAEAKAALGGYFREFTFALPEHSGWQTCACGHTEHLPGLVVDPFMGTGTTLRAALALGRRSCGFDLSPQYP